MTKKKNDIIDNIKNVLIAGKNFDTMLTSKLITLVYWIGLVVVAISGIISIFKDSPIAGLAIIIIGTLGVRIWCEIFIILFKINDNIKKLVDKE